MNVLHQVNTTYYREATIALLSVLFNGMYGVMENCLCVAQGVTQNSIEPTVLICRVCLVGTVYGIPAFV